MIWKLYIAMITAAFRHCVAACFGHLSVCQIHDQLAIIDQLNQIAVCVRQGYSLHPHFVKESYGGMDGFLRAALSEQDWRLLISIVEPSQQQPYPESLR